MTALDKRKLCIQRRSSLSNSKRFEKEKAITNCVLPFLKGKIVLDEFANRGVVIGQVPWNSSKDVRNYEEVDDSAIRNYLEHVYGLTGEKKGSNSI